MSIEYQGLEEIIEELGKLGNDEKTIEALNKAVALVERKAKQNAPKGELSQSIQGKVDGLTGMVYTPVFYAPYVEYGTGLYSDHPMGGRQEVPWVYVEGSGNATGKKTIHTEQSAKKAVASLKRQGFDAHMTYGQHPKPFMRPALNENTEEILRLFREVITND